MIDFDVHLAAIVAGDSGAFASWVAGAEPRIRGSLASFAAGVDTEAVVQECLLRVWQVAPRFKPDGKPEGLIRLGVRIARNLALAELRKRRPDLVDQVRLSETTGETGRPWESPEEFRDAIAVCFDQLPPKPRAAIEARLWQAGLQDRKLAAAVRMTINTFLQNVRRARLALAECLKRHGFDLEVRL